MRAERPLATLARLSGLTTRELLRFAEADLVSVPATTGDGGDLDPALLARLRRIHRLRRDLGLDPDAVEVVVRLLDRLEALGAGRPPVARVRIVRIVAE